MTYIQKTKVLLLGTFLAYALLVSTNLGEFWPFSIYPMFSQAGNTWERAVVRDVSDFDVRLLSWEPTQVDLLPGEAYPVALHGINQNDIANFISKTIGWSEKRTTAFRRLFGNDLTDRALLVYKVRGSLQADRTVDVAYIPWVLITPDTTEINQLGAEQ